MGISYQFVVSQHTLIFSNENLQTYRYFSKDILNSK